MFVKLLACLVLFISQVNASDSFSYSGRLVMESGEPATGPAKLTFDLIYSSQPSNILCTQTLNEVQLSNGVFHVKLDFPTCNLGNILKNTPSTQAVSIRVTDNTSGLNKIYSYQAIHAVPYSFVSQTSKQLDSLNAKKDEVLTWDGEKWAPTELSNLITVSEPEGEAGGALTGNYPNPGLAPIAQSNVVDLVSDLASKIGLGSLSATPPLLYNNATGAFSLDNSAIEKLDELEYFPVGDGLVLRVGSTLFSKTCNDDEVLKWTSPAGWDCAADDNVDDTKLPLTGGTLTGDLTLASKLIIKNGPDHSVVIQTLPSNADYALTLPPNAGGTNQVLTTNGGVLTWEDPETNAEPSGPAGGALDGTYPDPSLKDIPQNKITGLEAALDSKISHEDLTVISPLDYNNTLGLFTISEATTASAGTLSALDKTKLDSLETLPSDYGLIERWTGGLRSLVCLQDEILKWNGTIWSCAIDDNVDASKLPLGGGTLTGPLVLAATTPEAGHAVTKSYVDELVGNNASKWTTATGGINYGGGNVGIGTTNPLQALHISRTNGSSVMFLESSSSTAAADSGLALINYNNIGSQESVNRIEAFAARGTNTSPSLTLNNDRLFYLLGRGYSGTDGFLGFNAAAGIDIFADGNMASGSSPGRLEICTTSTGSLLNLSKVDATAYNPASATWQEDTMPTLKVHNPANSNLVGSQIILNNRTSTSEKSVRLLGLSTDNGSAFAVVTGARGAENERFRIDALGNVGIGTSIPGAPLTVSQNPVSGTGLPNGTIGHFQNIDGNTTRLLIDSFGTSNIKTSNLTFRTAGGTAASQTSTLLNDVLGQISWFGYGTTGYSIETRANIRATAANDWTDSAQGTSLSFQTTPLDSLSTREVMRINHEGNVGIGVSVPSNKLHVDGNIGATGWIGAGCEGACSSDSHAIIYPDGRIATADGSSPTCIKAGGSATFSCSSDEKLKNSISLFTDGLDHILKLQPKTYYWNNDDKNVLNYGFIAQEVQKVVPHAVTEQERSDGTYLSLDQGAFTPYMINAIKDLNSKMEDEYGRRISSLEDENEKIKAENKMMKAFLCEKYPEADFCK